MDPEEGTDRSRNYHDSIGLFTQKGAGFSLYGPWFEHPGNPILAHGSAQSYDGKHLLDCSPVWGKGPDGREDILYLFYKGVSYGQGSCLAGAHSRDGGHTFTKFPTNPLQCHVGPNDVVFHGNKYYVFYGAAKFDAVARRHTDRLKIYVAVTSDPTDLTKAARHLAIDVGPPGASDSRSVNGARIFRLGTRWFMVYQASAVHFDYPDRFHAAHSTDLINWTRVANPLPLFERGEPGEWDQGAIWFGEVFEHAERLYMLYEGWGRRGSGFNRDRAYAKPGRSQTGIASTSVSRFVEWCGLAGASGEGK